MSMMGGTDRSGGSEGLEEGLSGSQGGQGTGGAAVVGERLDVDGVGAVVPDDSLLGRDAGGSEGDTHDSAEELHFG